MHDSVGPTDAAEIAPQAYFLVGAHQFGAGLVSEEHVVDVYSGMAGAMAWEHQQEATIVGERADRRFDPDVLRAKYAQERERRLRSDGTK